MSGLGTDSHPCRRFSWEKATTSRIDGLSRKNRPSRSKHLTNMVTGSPRLTSSWVKSPFLARSTTAPERSVPVMRTGQRSTSGKDSLSIIAMLDASCPVEHAADQMFKLWVVRRPSIIRGSTSRFSASKGR